MPRLAKRRGARTEVPTSENALSATSLCVVETYVWQ
jgi:hypothetical protein